MVPILHPCGVSISNATKDEKPQGELGPASDQDRRAPRINGFVRRQRQHDRGRYRERSERHNATVDDDRDQHHRGHEKPTLGRDVAAGQQQIKGGRGKGCGRR
jgi:hypothetical protein